jgi:hypothetical protein
VFGSAKTPYKTKIPCRKVLQKTLQIGKRFFGHKIKSHISLVILGGFAAFLSSKDKNTL